MRFKSWFYENLAGPGGGPEPKAQSMKDLGLLHAKRGVGAFPVYDDDELPPSRGQSPLAQYLPPHTMKSTSKMKKQMRKK